MSRAGAAGFYYASCLADLELFETAGSLTGALARVVTQELPPLPPRQPESQMSKRREVKGRQHSNVHGDLWLWRPMSVKLCDDSLSASALSGAFRVLGAADDLTDIAHRTPETTLVAALLVVGGEEPPQDLGRALAGLGCILP